LPKVPLLTLSAALGAGSFLVSTRQTQPRRSESTPAVPGPQERTEAPVDRMEELLQVDPLELETGYRLIALSDPARGDLLDRIRGVRQLVALELGLIVPQVRIHDEMALGPHDYRFRIRGVVVGQGVAYAGRLLAVPPAALITRPDGRDGVDPFTGQPAVWIHADNRDAAEAAGCRILEPSAVVAGHFGEVLLDHADELMTHDQVRRLLERGRASAPALVEEVVPGLLRAGELQRVLQNLVRERVSIRDLEAILEALAEHAGKTRDTALLSEHVRRSLGRRLVQPYLGDDGHLRVVALARSLDARLSVAGSETDTPPAAALGNDIAKDLVRAVAMAVGPLVEAGHPPVVVCSAEARTALKDLTRADLPRLVVFSQREIPRDVPIETYGTVVEEEMPVVTSTSTAWK
jgi:flagellar biosynthesis protein FlhA